MDSPQDAEGDDIIFTTIRKFVEILLALRLVHSEFFFETVPTDVFSFIREFRSRNIEGFRRTRDNPGNWKPLRFLIRYFERNKACWFANEEDALQRADTLVSDIRSDPLLKAAIEKQDRLPHDIIAGAIKNLLNRKSNDGLRDIIIAQSNKPKARRKEIVQDFAAYANKHPDSAYIFSQDGMFGIKNWRCTPFCRPAMPSCSWAMIYDEDDCAPYAALLAWAWDIDPMKMHLLVRLVIQENELKQIFLTEHAPEEKIVEYLLSLGKETVLYAASRIHVIQSRIYIIRDWDVTLSKAMFFQPEDSSRLYCGNQDANRFESVKIKTLKSLPAFLELAAKRRKHCAVAAFAKKHGLDELTRKFDQNDFASAQALETIILAEDWGGEKWPCLTGLLEKEQRENVEGLGLRTLLLWPFIAHTDAEEGFAKSILKYEKNPRNDIFGRLRELCKAAANPETAEKLRARANGQCGCAIHNVAKTMRSQKAPGWGFESTVYNFVLLNIMMANECA